VIVDVVSASMYVGEIVTCASARPGSANAARRQRSATRPADVRAA
jgi:hypothetical protein